MSIEHEGDRWEFRVPVNRFLFATNLFFFLSLSVSSTLFVHSFIDSTDALQIYEVTKNEHKEEEREREKKKHGATTATIAQRLSKCRRRRTGAGRSTRLTRVYQNPCIPAYCIGLDGGCGTAVNCVNFGFISCSNLMKAPLLPIWSLQCGCTQTKCKHMTARARAHMFS